MANEQEQREGRFYRLLLPAAALVLAVWLFFPILFQNGQFIYRDATDFYYPLWHRIQESLNAGEAPLWDSTENLGQPLLANPTSAVYYPFKLIFFFTWCFPASYGLCFKAFVLIHYALALGGIYRLARHLGRSPTASTAAALAYTFSGPVFFQYCNPIFLVGAALLPWGILAGERLLRTRSVSSVAVLAGVLALTVLGGDPQTAYIIGLLLLALLWVQKRAGFFAQNGVIQPPERLKPERLKKKKSPKQPRFRLFFAQKPALARLALLGLAGLFGGLLASAAILPARVMEKYCDRSAVFAPNSVWEIPRFLRTYRDLNRENGPNAEVLAGTASRPASEWIADGILCRDGEDSLARYRFSVHPWSLPELIWPSFNGNMLCGNSWIDHVFPDQQYWTATISFGVLPFLLALGAFRLRRRKKWSGETEKDRAIVVWLSVIFALGLLASLGGYGLQWFLRNGWNGLIGEPWTGCSEADPVGGVYWLMVVFLPKFALFRYPAKLLSVAMFGGALLAAFGVDFLLDSKRLRRGAFALSCVSILAACLAGAVFSAPFERFASGAFNLFDPAATLRLIRISQFETAALLILFAVLLRFRSRMAPKAFAAVILLLVVVDLARVNLGTLPTLPDSAVHRASRCAATILAEMPIDGTAPTPRLYDALGDRICGDQLVSIPSSERTGFLANWKNEIFTAKRHYLSDVAVFPCRGTMMPIGSSVLDGWIYNQMNGGAYRSALGDLFGLLDIPYAVIPSEEAARLADYVPVENAQIPENISILKRKTPSKRIFISRTGKPSANWTDPAVFRANLRREAADLSPNEFVRFERYEPNKLVFLANLEKPSDIWLSEQFWPGWKAEAIRLDGNDKENLPIPVEIRPDPLFQTMRIVPLEAGSWRVALEYRPTEVPLGLFVSLGTACFLIAWTCFVRKRGSEGGK